jgi:hypothetical protein
VTVLQSEPSISGEHETRGAAENKPIESEPRTPSDPIGTPLGQSRGNPDPVEAALAKGIEAAAVALGRGDAGALETMKALAAELEARRKARADVVELHVERAKRTR